MTENAQRPYNETQTVAIVTDGSAVLDLGNIGAYAALPIMEGKAKLYKKTTGITAVPICLDTQDPDEIAETIKRIAPTFTGINLEGVAAPKCFEIERRLKEAELDIPLFLTDRDAPSAIICEAVVNACESTGRALKNARICICGAGRAGNGVAHRLHELGAEDIIICDSKGILGIERLAEFGEDKLALLEFTNKDRLCGGLAEALRERDILIGVSVPNAITVEMIQSMSPSPIVFMFSTPEPEISVDFARLAGAGLIGISAGKFWLDRIDIVWENTTVNES